VPQARSSGSRSRCAGPDLWRPRRGRRRFRLLLLCSVLLLLGEVTFPRVLAESAFLW